MATFSIKDIEAVSGIRCHTLRIWEQRYGIIVPKRTETNIRYYDDDDLKKIINISILNKNGYRISEIAKMSMQQICDLVLGISGCKNEYACQIKGLIGSMLSFDEYEFHQILTTSIVQIGMEQTMLNIVFPFLTEAGLLWQVGSIHPSHEHFASGIIKQKLYVAIDGNVGRYSENRKKFLLFLPENEKHSLGLLFANFILRSRGHEVLFLGHEVPMSNFKAAIGERQHPDYILTILTASHVCCDKQDFVNELSALWKETEILLTGSQVMQNDIVFPENVHVIKKMEHFIDFVSNIGKSYQYN